MEHLEKPMDQELVYELLRLAESRYMTARLCDHQDDIPLATPIAAGQLRVEDKLIFIVGEWHTATRDILAIEFDAIGVNIYI